eukprot:2713312-Rhodomonas_salina.4
MSGSAIAYAVHIILQCCYTMSGTDLLNAATRFVQKLPKGFQTTVNQEPSNSHNQRDEINENRRNPPRKIKHENRLAVNYAVCGTGLAFDYAMCTTALGMPSGQCDAVCSTALAVHSVMCSTALAVTYVMCGTALAVCYATCITALAGGCRRGTESGRTGGAERGAAPAPLHRTCHPGTACAVCSYARATTRVLREAKRSPVLRVRILVPEKSDHPDPR